MRKAERVEMAVRRTEIHHAISNYRIRRLKSELVFPEQGGKMPALRYTPFFSKNSRTTSFHIIL